MWSYSRLTTYIIACEASYSKYCQNSQTTTKAKYKVPGCMPTSTTRLIRDHIYICTCIAFLSRNLGPSTLEHLVIILSFPIYISIKYTTWLIINKIEAVQQKAALNRYLGYNYIYYIQRQVPVIYAPISTSPSWWRITARATIMKSKYWKYC